MANTAESTLKLTSLSASGPPCSSLRTSARFKDQGAITHKAWSICLGVTLIPGRLMLLLSPFLNFDSGMQIA